MSTLRKLTLGTLVGLILTFGISGLASAVTVSPIADAPSTSTPPTPTATSAPPTTTPSAPSTSTPAAATPASPSKKHATRTKKKLLTGNQIWRIVHSHRSIDCAHLTKLVKRVHAAEKAATTRMTHWLAKASAAQKSQTPMASVRMKSSTARAHGFVKLENDGQALLKRIEAKCAVTAPASPAA